MTWTTPKTWQDGELVGAEELNREIGDNQNALKYPPTETFITSDDYSSSSGSFVDVDDPDFVLEMDCHGGPVLVSLQCTINLSGLGSGDGYVRFDVAVDGTRYGGGDKGIVGRELKYDDNNKYWPIMFILWGIAAGEHEFKLQWAVDQGTANLRGGGAAGAANQIIQFAIRELN